MRLRPQITAVLFASIVLANVRQQTSVAAPYARESAAPCASGGMPMDTSPVRPTMNGAPKGLTGRLDGVGSTLFLPDANGNITNVIQGTDTNAWTFDAYDRVATYRDPSGFLIQYRYDNNGNVTVVTYPGNRSVTNSYNALNLLTNVTDWLGNQAIIDRDLAGRIVKITRPNGTLRIVNRDAAGGITNIVEKTVANFPIVFFKLGYSNSGGTGSGFRVSTIRMPFAPSIGRSPKA